MNDRLVIESPQGTIRYDDSVEHFENGVLRLLGLDREAFEHWLLVSEGQQGKDVLEKLGRGFARLSPLARTETLHTAEVEPGPGGERGAIWHPTIAENRSFGVARSVDGDLGWLIQLSGDLWRRETEAPAYEEDYFEGNRNQAGGYGDYGAQQDWRLEKAARQVRELGEATGLPRGRVLDVGSGYGYFQKALSDAGFEHDGLELSRHAREAAKARFGFEALDGTLESHATELAGRYDAVTLWDVLEHVADPTALLIAAARCLRPRGFVALKTPNIRCPEARVFGPHYHSLKREHLVYFTARSLVRAAEGAGLEPRRVTSVSHLLVGFLGADRTAELSARNEGADLVAYLQKPA
jgi:2-polyprenyl-3-methyl-5-hydroxy-6-metoxy-1,4-benzoquinol methylase